MHTENLSMGQIELSVTTFEIFVTVKRSQVFGHEVLSAHHCRVIYKLLGVQLD